MLNFLEKYTLKYYIESYQVTQKPLIGLGRAMEVVLGGGDLDAKTAERWGYLNRVFEADEIEDWVSNFAEGLRAFLCRPFV